MEKKLLHEILDIDADEDEISAKPPVSLNSENEVSSENELPVLGGSAAFPQDSEDMKIQKDFDDSRNNIMDALEIAKEALEKMAAIAHESEKDKDFIAVNNLVKTIIDGSEKSVSLYTRKIEYLEKKKKIFFPDDKGKDENRKQGVYIDKAVFTGTLDQMISSIEHEDENDNGDVDEKGED
jgi:hypothetical protein